MYLFTYLNASFRLIKDLKTTAHQIQDFQLEKHQKTSGPNGA